MKFLVDECIGPAVAHWLRTEGYDVRLIDGVLAGTDDEIILETAFREDRIIITSDNDFGEMIFSKKRKHKGVIFFRLYYERPSYKIAILKKIFEDCQNTIDCNFIVATHSAIRIIKF